MRYVASIRRGVGLVELMVSIGMMSFIFATMGYIVFTTGRNSLVVREQAMSQNQAGAASERLSYLLRNSRFMKAYDSDDISQPVQRLVYETPDPAEADGIRSGVVAFVPASSPNDSDGIIKIFRDEADYDPDTLEDTEADWEFTNIQDLEINFHSASWITLSIAYTYRGFSLSTTDADNDNIHDSLLAGNFFTDVIARNHHPGESAHYAETTNTLIQL